MMKKSVPVVIMLMLMSVSFFSGCIGRTIDTMGWTHKNQQGTAVTIYGQLAITESPDNWNEGFVWDTEAHANWQDYQYRQWADNHYGAGFFSLDIQNLSRTTQYHYRAYGEYLKAQSQFRFGLDGTFIPGGPRVTTENASGIGLTQVTLNGNLDDLGGASVCDVNFLYGTNQNALDHGTQHQNMTVTGPFSATVADLSTNTTYYYKAVAKNDADVWVGLILSVIPGQPVVVTRQPGEIGSDHAILKGELWHTGGTATCTVWFLYSDVSPNLLDHVTSPQDMNTTGPFQTYLGNLTPGTKYWYRTAADNGVAQGKGDIYDFITTPAGQTLTTGILGERYQPPAGTDANTLLARISPRYQHLLEKYPALARLQQSTMNHLDRK
jgi:hypothetical protein